jgi:hypothetical protein
MHGTRPARPIARRLLLAAGLLVAAGCELDRLNHFHDPGREALARRAASDFEDFTDDRAGLGPTLLANLAAQSALDRTVADKRIRVEQRDTLTALFDLTWAETWEALLDDLGVPNDLRRADWIGVAPGEPNDMLARILVSLEPGADRELVDRGAYLVAMQEQYAALNAVRARARADGAPPPPPVAIDRLDTRLRQLALNFRVDAGPRAERAAHSRRLRRDEPRLAAVMTTFRATRDETFARDLIGLDDESFGVFAAAVERELRRLVPPANGPGGDGMGAFVIASDRDAGVGRSFLAGRWSADAFDEASAPLFRMSDDEPPDDERARPPVTSMLSDRIDVRVVKIAAIARVLEALGTGEKLRVARAKRNVRAADAATRRLADAAAPPTTAPAAPRESGAFVDVLGRLEQAIRQAGRDALATAEARDQAMALQRKLLETAEASRDPASVYALVAAIGTGLGDEDFRLLDAFLAHLEGHLERLGSPMPSSAAAVGDTERDFVVAVNQARVMMRVARAPASGSTEDEQDEPEDDDGTPPTIAERLSAAEDALALWQAARSLALVAADLAPDDIERFIGAGDAIAAVVAVVAELGGVIDDALARDWEAALLGVSLEEVLDVVDRVRATIEAHGDLPRRDELLAALDTARGKIAAVDELAQLAEEALEILRSLDGPDALERMVALFEGDFFGSFLQPLETLGVDLSTEIADLRELTARLSGAGELIDVVRAVTGEPGEVDPAELRTRLIAAVRKTVESNPRAAVRLDDLLDRELPDGRTVGQHLDAVVSDIVTQAAAARLRVARLLAELHRLELDLHEENLRHWIVVLDVTKEELRRWRRLRDQVADLEAVMEFDAGAPVLFADAATTEAWLDDRSIAPEGPRPPHPVDRGDNVLSTLRHLAATARDWQRQAPADAIFVGEGGDPGADDRLAWALTHRSNDRLRRAVAILNHYLLITRINVHSSELNGVRLRTEIIEHEIHVDRVVAGAKESPIRYGLGELLAYHSTGVTDADIQNALALTQNVLLVVLNFQV